ncbi:MAG: gamma carbonic anhydrase family protein [Acidimicrobiaceae bacterium]|nr:gamma carbonic anhydrase family protein [Acidimicrobiaceae bacterium]MXW76521.1 gamma carbonic anhydrase family protein [Acidimicrobiaceae bacterium]MYC43765.1 gamma carbonic anhydrase family protein [Acidimicrobiaceae bacterium]MYD06039.1 gamma carbonic anhydrase family protein [Acidimicrobiaceae bacterium]MYH88370.1 gamma carbonic anhydrase family protein [Acidimicrobiaceae bacterium]
MAVYALGDRVPEIHPDAYIHPDATLIGSVVIGAGSSVWAQAVIRADDNFIRIGRGSSIQDGAVLHCTEVHETTVGDYVTIGHLAHLEGCHVLDRSLIGTGSIVLHDAVIGPEALVGAAALVPAAMVVPTLAMALGVPARIRENALQKGANDLNFESYMRRAKHYPEQLRRID